MIYYRHSKRDTLSKTFLTAWNCSISRTYRADEQVVESLVCWEEYHISKAIADTKFLPKSNSKMTTQPSKKSWSVDFLATKKPHCQMFSSLIDEKDNSMLSKNCYKKSRISKKSSTKLFLSDYENEQPEKPQISVNKKLEKILQRKYMDLMLLWKSRKPKLFMMTPTKS